MTQQNQESRGQSQELRQEEEQEKLPRLPGWVSGWGCDFSLLSFSPLNRSVRTRDRVHPVTVRCVRSLLHVVPRSSARGRGLGTKGASGGPSGLDLVPMRGPGFRANAETVDFGKPP